MDRELITLLLITILLLLILYYVFYIHKSNNINLNEVSDSEVLPLNTTFLDRWFFWNNRYPVDWGVPSHWRCPGGSGCNCPHGNCSRSRGGRGRSRGGRGRGRGRLNPRHRRGEISTRIEHESGDSLAGFDKKGGIDVSVGLSGRGGGEGNSGRSGWLPSGSSMHGNAGRIGDGGSGLRVMGGGSMSRRAGGRGSGSMRGGRGGGSMRGRGGGSMRGGGGRGRRR